MKYELNTKIGNLLIVDYSSSKCYYRFKCSCGKEFIGTAQTIKQKYKQLEKFGTAGCKLCINKIRREQLPEVEFYTPIYKQYKRDAIKRSNRTFELSKEEATKLFTSSCHYCNANPSNSIKIGERIITYQGIDRMEQDKGYISSNVVPCCKTCNYAKNVLNYNEFLQHINKIYNNVQRLDRKIVGSSDPKWEAPYLFKREMI